MTVRVIFKFFRDFYGQNYAYPTVNNSDSDEQSSQIDEYTNLDLLAESE